MGDKDKNDNKFFFLYYIFKRQIKNIIYYLFKLDSASKLKRQKIDNLNYSEICELSDYFCKIMNLDNIIIKEKYPGIFEFSKKIR